MDVAFSTLSWAKDLPLQVQILSGLGLAFIAFTAYYISKLEFPYRGIPIVELKPTTAFRRFFSRDSSEWNLHGREVLNKGFAEHTGLFQVRTGTGYKIVVPNRFADELRNMPHLGFNEFFMKELFINYPGFDAPRETMKYETFIPEVVRVKLTQSLGLITDDLVDETQASFSEVIGHPKDWTTRQIKSDVLQIVARLSSRVFLGKGLCRNEAWLEVSKNYTVDLFRGAQLLKDIPAFLRPIMYWTVPECTRLREQVKVARELIQPEVDRRVKGAEAAIARGEKVSKTSDCIGWMVECARGQEINYAACQLSLAMAAIHTTTETFSRSIIQLTKTPEIVQPLREEVIQVLREDGWAKTSLYKLKLMDSFLKEVQRASGMAITSMNRMVKKKTVLSDGNVLPAGSRIMVGDNRTQDPTLYDEPSHFRVDRFMRMRAQAGNENRFQFVTTSSDHMGFGHGLHACPGRFFASNELKIALCYTLLHYDLKAADMEGVPDFFEFETGHTVMPTMKMQVRARTPEIDFVVPK